MPWLDLDDTLTPLLMRAASMRNFPQKEEIDPLAWASRGVAAWIGALKKGRLPDEEMDGMSALWPGEPLRAYLTNVLAELQLPRFVQRHP